MSVSALPQGMPPGEVGHWEFDCAYLPHTAAGIGLGCKEAAGHGSCVGKQSLRCGAKAALRAPRPAMRQRPWGSQALGHPGASGSHGSTDNCHGRK